MAPERNTRVRASQILNIRPSDITASATNSPNDGDVASKAIGADEWTWVTPGAGASDKISEGDSSVEVLDISGEAPQVKFTIDNVEQLRIEDGVIVPTTDNDIDLGDSTHAFKDLYIDGLILEPKGISFQEQASNPLDISGTAYKGLWIDSADDSLNYWDGSSNTILSGVASTESYTTSFDNADLTAGVLTVTHDLSQKFVAVKIYNNSDGEIIPDEITLSSTSALTVDLSSYGTIAGTWNVVVISSITASGGIGGRYSTSFTNATLSSGILTATHSLSTKYVQVYIYDNNDKLIIADSYTATSTSVLTVDLSSYGTLTGTWNIVILA